MIFWSFKQILFCNIWGPPIELAHFRAPIKVNVAIFRWVGHTDTHLLVGHFYIRIKPLAPYHFKKNYDCKIVKRKLERFTYHFVLQFSMRLTGCWGLNISGSVQNVKAVDRHNFYPKIKGHLFSSLFFSLILFSTFVFSLFFYHCCGLSAEGAHMTWPTCSPRVQSPPTPPRHILKIDTIQEN